MPSQTHKAFFVLAPNTTDYVTGDTETPKPNAGEILVKVHAAALNPVDWKAPKYNVFIDKYPAVLGADAAGEVVQLGEGVNNFAVGDRVFFPGLYSPSKYATFQQYAIADAGFSAKIPDGLSFDQASTIPMALATAYLSLYWELKLTSLTTSGAHGKYADTPIVILGGGSAVGQFAIQLLTMSGFSPIITTASLKHTKYLESLGATHVIDRFIPFSSLSATIAKITSKPIQYVYDAISLPETQQGGYDLLSETGKIALVLPPSIKEDGSSKEVVVVKGLRSVPEQIEFVQGLYRALPGWLEKGWIKTTPLEVLPGGIEGIHDGLKRLENDQVSGAKLVSHLWD